MRFLLTVLCFATLSACAPHPHMDTRMDVGASIVNGNVRSFYLALGDYYRVPEREVMFIRERRIPDYDIPVVLFISQRARIAPAAIIDLRLSGRSWMDITLHFGLGPDIYYVPAREVYGPPYGHAYGHYKNRPRNDWHRIRLNDGEVVDMVNLRFMSEHYGRPPEDVMRMRSSGKNFFAINEDFRRGKPGNEYREREREQFQEQRMDRRQDQRLERQDQREEFRQEQRMERPNQRQEFRQEQRMERPNQRQEFRQEQRTEQREIREQRRSDEVRPSEPSQRSRKDQGTGKESKGPGRDDDNGRPGKSKGRDREE